MSKKNNRKTRQNALQFAIQREREAQQKKIEKAIKKQDANQQEAGPSSSTHVKSSTSASPLKPGFSIPGVSGKKFKRKGIRLRKNSMVRGIRIKDASSRQKVKEILAAEEAMREMMVEDGPVEDRPKKLTTKKATVGGGGVKKKKAAKADKRPAAMALD